MERPVVEALFGKRAGAFAKARIVDHPHFITVFGECRCILGISADVLFIAMKVEHYAAGYGVGGGELYYIDVDGGRIRQVDFFIGCVKVVIVVRFQRLGVEHELILQVIEGNADEAVDHDDDAYPTYDFLLHVELYK